MNSYDIVIVGGGPAGLTASIYAVRANMKTLVLDKLAPGGQIINTNEIANYTGFGVINGAELAIKMFEHSQEAGAEFEYKTVLAIRDEGAVKKVICEEEGTVYEARAVIIATGTRPRRLGVPGEEAHAGAGISWCAVCDGALYRGKVIAAVVASPKYAEEVEYLAGFAEAVHAFCMYPGAAFRAENIVVHLQKPLAVEGNMRVERLALADGKLEVAAVFFLRDAAPPAALVGGLETDGAHVKVARDLSTNLAGLFAAGDITGRPYQYIKAAGEGCTAAYSAHAYLAEQKQ